MSASVQAEEASGGRVQIIVREDGRWAGGKFAGLEPGDRVEFSDIPGKHWLIKTEPKHDPDGILFVEVEEIQGSVA